MHEDSAGMKILHYFLGFPPYRTGGLTKYAFDLMKTQAEQGETVAALWPGQKRLFHSGVSVKRRRDAGRIENYELINPLPVPLDEGIACPEIYTRPCDKAVYRSFLSKLRPDAIHIHTLMGLHRELVMVAGEMGVRTVFTTHDYFGICPKVTLYRQGAACEHDHNCEDCVQCNMRALSVKKIWMMQSPMYRCLKDSFVVKWLRKRHRSGYFAEKTDLDIQMAEEMITAKGREYRKLREYYCSMLSAIDMIHFNSSVAGMVYKRYVIPKDSRVITITHQNIQDNRQCIKWIPADRLRITFLAAPRPFKGFEILKNVLDSLWSTGKKNFKLKAFGPVNSPSPYMEVSEEGFQTSQLKDILAETDVVVAPSIWYETFGFTVLEAISYGVPVIVSDRVGAKDVVGDGGIVVTAGSEEALREAVLSLDESKIYRMREIIREEGPVKTWKQLLDEMYALYTDSF